MKTLLFSIITLVAVSSFAQQMRAREVAQLYYSAHCDQRCQSGVSVDLYTAQNLFRLPAEVTKSLDRVAFAQAQIWGDTILEGDYVAEGKTQLEEVIVIREGARVVGYAITYSERAWYTGECLYVNRNPQTLSSCEEGRIRERSFVSASFNEAEVDQNKFADFKAND